MESDHWYVPGKTAIERQHVSEHETLQTLQKHDRGMGRYMAPKDTRR